MKPPEDAMTRLLKIAITAAVTCMISLLALGAAHAGELTIVSAAGPLPEVLNALVPAFERATGNTVTISFKGGPAITADLKGGANVDVVVGAPEFIEGLAKDGQIV